MSDILQKRCTACEKDFPATAEFFYRQKLGKYGLRSQCKGCSREKDKASHQAAYSRPEVLEKKRERDRARRKRPEVRERYRQYYSQPLVRERKRKQLNASNSRPEARARHIEYNHRYYNQPQTRERILEQHHEYRNRPEVHEHLRAYDKERYAHPEGRARRRAHRRNRDARKRIVAGRHTASQIQDLLTRQRYRCYYAACGHARFKRVKGKYEYHIEHTFPLSRVAGTDTPANDIGYLVLSCPRCNTSKQGKYPWEWPEGGRLL